MMYTGLSDAIHNELVGMEDKYAGGAQMNQADLDMIDKMFHALKCLATYEAMDEAYPRNRGRERGYGYGRRY